MDSLRFKQWWAKDFLFSILIQIGTAAHSASCTMGTRAPSWRKSGQGVVLIPQPYLAQRFKKELRHRANMLSVDIYHIICCLLFLHTYSKKRKSQEQEMR
jgi:hypothetical protein